VETIARRIATLVIAAGLVAGIHPVTSGRSQTSTPASPLASLVDSIVGSEDESGASADLTAAAFAERLKTIKALLEQLRKIDRHPLSFDDGLDLRFAETILVGRELSQERMQFW
jgi:hypothetical protein